MVLVTGTLSFIAAGPAQAETCYWSGPTYDRTQTCSGIHHEYLGSKTYMGTSSFSRQYPRLVVSAMVKDKAADGNCAYAKYHISNAYPQTHVLPRVCGAGNEKAFTIDLNSNQVWAGTTVTVYHCQEGPLGCTAHFSRTF